MRRCLLMSFSFLLLAASGARADEFLGLRCAGDIPKQLIGKREGSGKVVDIEARHRDLTLRHLGADIIADQMNTIGWEICGKEFLVLDRRFVIADVIAFPAHSRATPAFSGSCRDKGKDVPGTVVGVLDGAAKGDMLPAKAAWRVDEKAGKFAALETADLLCARAGVYTSDGGQ